MSGSFDAAGRPTPTEIRLLQAERTLIVTFDDGAVFHFPAEFLRVLSPSAEVRGHGGEQPPVAGKRNVAIVGLEPVGNYAVRILFDDRHDTGIFSWEFFYEHGRDQTRLWNDYLAKLARYGFSRDS